LLAVELHPKKVAARRTISLARRNSRTSCSRSLTRSDSLMVTPGRTPSSTSACLTQLRTDSTPYPSCSATRRTAPWVIPVSACSERTILTAAAFSCVEYRRVVGFPDVRSVGMNSVLDFPRPRVSNQPRTVHSLRTAASSRQVVATRFGRRLWRPPSQSDVLRGSPRLDHRPGALNARRRGNRGQSSKTSRLSPFGARDPGFP
jgi:hypothetical protein